MTPTESRQRAVAAIAAAAGDGATALEQALRERDALLAERDALYRALLDVDCILWMAREYAEAGGENGPEMRDYREAEQAVERVLRGTVQP